MSDIIIELHEEKQLITGEDGIQRMEAGLMKALLGGEFPDTGFNWEYAEYFKLEDGIWEPYNGIDNDNPLPAVGFIIEIKVSEF